MALAANGERLLVFADDDQRLLDVGVESDVADLSRLQSIGDQDDRLGIPTDDVDALAVEFIDDRFDAVAANANAGADAIDLVVVRVDGQLGAVSRLALDAANLDRAIGDLRHFDLEQGTYEVAVRAAQDDLDARADLLDLVDEGANALADVVVLAANLLGAWQDAFEVAAQVDDDGVAFEALHVAADDLT